MIYKKGRNLKIVCAKDDCAGCMLHTDICSLGAVSLSVEIKAYNVHIDEISCMECGFFHSGW